MLIFDDITSGSNEMQIQQFHVNNCVKYLGCSARWIGNHGFSIGIDDVQPSKYLNERRLETIFRGYQGCHEKIKSYNEGKLPPETGCDAAQTLEAEITRILNNIRDETGKVKF